MAFIISLHTMPLINNSLRSRHTHTRTRTHTQMYMHTFPHGINFNKPGVHCPLCMLGLKIFPWNNNATTYINTSISKKCFARYQHVVYNYITLYLQRFLPCLYMKVHTGEKKLKNNTLHSRSHTPVKLICLMCCHSCV